jgi:cytokinin trans-hydroxylase
MLLAENPEWQRKLREEVKDKLGDRPQGNRALNSQEISQMKLLQNVIMETLRLYPPGKLLSINIRVD